MGWRLQQAYRQSPLAQIYAAETAVSMLQCRSGERIAAALLLRVPVSVARIAISPLPCHGRQPSALRWMASQADS